jgi:hypothetical protein
LKSSTNRKLHEIKHEKTRSITYRLPVKLVEDLETEANQKEISHNVLVKQILEKYTQWDKFANVMGMVPIPKEILQTLGENMKGEEINKIIDVILPMIKDWVMFMKGNYDLKRAIESLEDYMRASGMISDHRIEGNAHHFIIQHNLGMRWSLFTEQLLRHIFHQFLPETPMNCKTTQNTTIVSIALGSEFDEHTY